MHRTHLPASALALAAMSVCAAAAPPERNPRATAAHAELEVMDGFRAELVIGGLTYPTSVEFTGDGGVYVAEAGYSYGDPIAPARVLEIATDGSLRVVATGFQAPVNDLLAHGDQLLVADRGRVLRLEPESGSMRPLVTNLPSDGDHHNNQLAVGPDGKIYWGQGTATNSGVVGVDNYKMGWLATHPDFHDRPARPISLRDQIFRTPNPLTLKKPSEVKTTAFHPFGVRELGRVGPAEKPTGAIMRMKPDGGGLEVVAWGLRNPYGVVWTESGEGYISENGFDVRGSRPIANDPEDLYALVEDAWYGWPDYGSGFPVTDPRFTPPSGEAPEFLMAEHPPVEIPVLTFPPHSAITKLASVSGEPAALDGMLLAAFWGHMTPMTGNVQEHGGHRVLAIDPETWESRVLLKSAHDHGKEGHGGSHDGSRSHAASTLNRPIDVAVAPDGRAIYVVDFGELEVSKEKGVMPKPGTGKLWRLVPAQAQHQGPPANLQLSPSLSSHKSDEKRRDDHE